MLTTVVSISLKSISEVKDMLTTHQCITTIYNSNNRRKKSYPEYTKAEVLKPPEELTVQQNLQMHNIVGRTGVY